MIFSYNWLQSFFEKKLPKPEKLAELLTMHSFEVSEVRSGGRGDSVLDIDVLPNRTHDSLSHFGMAREIAALTNQKLKLLPREKLKIIKSKLKPIDLKIRCPRLTPHYSAIVIEGVKIDKSPHWLKEKLEAVGTRSINNIVDLTNFVMLEMGQPLHAFDYDKIQEQKMILRKSQKGERVMTLDDIEHTLDDGMLVIEAKKRIIDLVGIMGGKLSEISSKTKNIVLQAGNFDRRTIYQTTKKLNHSTDASNIYIQGIDPNLTFPALERTHFLLKELGGGKVVQIIDVYPKKVYPKRIKLDLDYVESLLGVKISTLKIKDILKRLDFRMIDFRNRSMVVEVPTRRLDISIPEDLIEEIARVYGYEKIPIAFPVVSLIPSKKNDQIFWENMVKDILKEAGFTEVYNYSFVKEGGQVEVENPISQEYKYLRPSLIPNLLKNVEKNIKNFSKIKIFELGKVFNEKEEKRMLTGIVTGEDFYQLKGVADLLLNKLGISNVWYDDYQASPEDSPKSLWHPQKSAEIKVDHQELGFLGELRGEPKAGAFDLDFEILQKLSSEEHEYRPISRYPAAIRDLAVLVPPPTRVEEVLNVIEIAGGPLVRDVDLFDIYEGEELPGGKKNLAFHIVYQAEDRTLKSIEVYKIHQKIIKDLEKNPTWQVRK